MNAPGFRIAGFSLLVALLVIVAAVSYSRVQPQGVAAQDAAGGGTTGDVPVASDGGPGASSGDPGPGDATNSGEPSGGSGSDGTGDPGGNASGGNSGNGGGNNGGGNNGGGGSGSGGVPGAPIGGGGGGGAVAAPIGIPAFQIVGADFREQRAEVEKRLVEACDDGTLCVDLAVVEAPPQGGQAGCTVQQVPRAGEVKRGATITFVVAAPCDLDSPPGEEPGNAVEEPASGETSPGKGTPTDGNAEPPGGTAEATDGGHPSPDAGAQQGADPAAPSQQNARATEQDGSGGDTTAGTQAPQPGSPATSETAGTHSEADLQSEAAGTQSEAEGQGG